MKPNVTIQDVETAVSEYFDIHPNNLKSKFRFGDLPIARKILVYIAFYKAGIKIADLESYLWTTQDTVISYATEIRETADGVTKTHIANILNHKTFHVEHETV